MAQTSCTFRDLIENFPANVRVNTAKLTNQISHARNNAFSSTCGGNMVSTWRAVPDFEQSAEEQRSFVTQPIAHQPTIRRVVAPLCSENSSNFEASPTSATTFEDGNNGFQPALFRTWKFSVRPTSRTTTRNFKLGWRLKWENIFPPP